MLFYFIIICATNTEGKQKHVKKIIMGFTFISRNLYIFRETMTVEEFKKYVRFVPTERENTNRLLEIGCENQKGLKRCVMEKGKWETYLESLKLVDDGEVSPNIDLDDFMPTP